MTQSTVEEKLSALLARVDDALAANQLPKSAALLREASQLSPQDDKVKKRWLALQDCQGGTGALELIRLYLASGQAEDGQKALQSLGQNQLAEVEASAAYDLVSPKNSLPLLDELLGALLGRQLEACLLYTSPSPRDGLLSRMPSSA